MSVSSFPQIDGFRASGFGLRDGLRSMMYGLLTHRSSRLRFASATIAHRAWQASRTTVARDPLPNRSRLRRRDKWSMSQVAILPMGKCG